MAKKKKLEEQENLDRWLVSYADFITLLFAFFTTMYALASINEGKYRVVSDSLSMAFNQSGATGRESMKQETSEPFISSAFKKTFTGDYKKLHTAFAGLEKDNKIYMSIEKRGVVVSLSEQIIFEAGKADILDNAKAVIDDIAMVLKQMPNHIKIEGHTDNIPINTPQFPSNWELSAARALNILKYMLDVHGFNPGKLSATGYGEFRPFAPNDTLDGRAKNRRVDIVILNSEGTLNEPD